MKRLPVSMLLALFVSASVVQGQDYNDEKQLGIGISIEPALFGASLFRVTAASFPDGSYFLFTQPTYSSTPYNIYIPIHVSKHFRIEPQFGLYLMRSEQTVSVPVSQFLPAYTYSYKAEVTLFRIGVGIVYLIPTTERFQMYLGPRFAFNFASALSSGPGTLPPPSVQQSETTTKQTDIIVTALFGAEYFAISSLSIGGEVDLDYVSFGEPDITHTPPSSSGNTSNLKQYLISSGALFFVRWYFW